MNNLDKVGYGRPPRHSQFKKGQSGNSKGRPKGSRNNRSIMEVIAHQKVSVHKNGKRKTIPYMEAFTLKFMADMMNAPTSDRLKFFNLLAEYKPEESEDLPRVILNVHFVEPKPRSDEEPAVEEADLIDITNAKS